jgi:putative transposase
MVDQQNPTKRSRRSIRLKEFDYSQPGSYFVTIVIHERRCLFGNVLEGQVTLSSSGIIVCEILQGISERFSNVSVDMFVVMPNHLHVILNVGAQFIAPADGVGRPESAMNRVPTLGQIIRTLKAASTQRIRQTSDSGFAWQRNYYEHVIRDEESLNRIRQYILDNPLKWGLDPENPEAISPEATDTWRVP